MRQFSKDERAPCEAPELVRIRERNSTPDADVFRRILLKQVADDPAESAKKDPKDHMPRCTQFSMKLRNTSAKRDCHQRHGPQLANGENGHEGQRIHSADI